MVTMVSAETILNVEDTSIISAPKRDDGHKNK